MATVDTPHPDYVRWATHWRKMRDVALGQEAMDRVTIGARLPTGPVSDSGLLGRDYYLPPLSGQNGQEYAAYVKRASFYGATTRTIDALVGAIFRQAPVVNGSDELMHQLEDVDLAGSPIETFAKLMVSEVLTTGRYGVLVDAPPDGSVEARPYWTGYAAEDILSWSTARIGGQIQLQRVVLRECPWAPQDEFGYVRLEQYRVLDIDEAGYYRQRLYQAAPSADLPAGFIGEAYPTRAGERLTTIPFVFVGPTSIAASPERPPLLDLADVNLAHYRKAADYAHGLHFTALPTPWIADRDVPKGPFKIGSETAWTMSEVGNCGMLEFSGAGMSAIKDAMLDDENRMAHLGAELLMPDKRAVEAASALRLRSNAKTASVASVANTGSWALSKAAEYHAWWIGDSDQVIEETSVLLNTEFAESHLDPAELTAWVQARQAGEVTRRMFLERLQKYEALGEQPIDEVLVELNAEADTRAERDALKAEAQKFKDMAALVTDNAAQDMKGGKAA